MQNKKYDIVCAGELLVDMISENFAENLSDISTFRRIPGGSPANLCMNMARLGNQTSLVANVGNDDMGTYLYDFVASQNVDCQYLNRVSAPTTLILVTRSKTVSNFEAYRGADCQLLPEHLPDELLKQAKIFHTTCFALSHEPAQSSILNAARRAAALRCQLSIDANYAQKIWQNTDEARALVADYCRLGAMVKVSEVDWERLYGSKLLDAEAALEHFLALGAREVCVTLGGDGCWAATATERLFLPARPVEVKDTTGAGDAFWSGYLTAWLDGKNLSQKLQAGRKMAEIKLGFFGTLPHEMNKKLIYEE